MDRRLNGRQEAVKSQHGRVFATNPLGTIQKRFLRWNGIRIHKHKELSKRTSKDFEKLSRWSFRQIDRVLFGGFPNIRDDLHRYADMRTIAVSCSAFGSRRSAQP
jgi:hypothetical protein